MARVLFLTQVLPYPLDAGPKVRQYHMLLNPVRNLGQVCDLVGYAQMAGAQVSTQLPGIRHRSERLG